MLGIMAVLGQKDSYAATLLQWQVQGSFCWYCHLASSLPWFAGPRPRPHITAVMQGRGELHCDGLPLVSEPRAPPSLPPRPRGGPSAINPHGSTARHQHEGNTVRGHA